MNNYAQQKLAGQKASEKLDKLSRRVQEDLRIRRGVYAANGDKLSQTLGSFENKVSKIAFAGDWHGDYRYACRALHYAKKQGVDVVVHVGDLGIWSNSRFLKSLDKEAQHQDLYVLFVDGNHEDHDWLDAQPVSQDGIRYLTQRIWHLPRGFVWTWSNVCFMALGGAVSVDKQWRRSGVDWFKQEELSESDKRHIQNNARLNKVDVLVAHDCPSIVDIPGINTETSDWIPYHVLMEAKYYREILTDLFKIINPRYLFHGHYHVDYQTFVDTDVNSRTCAVYGLNMNGTSFDKNMKIFSMDELKSSKIH